MDGSTVKVLLVEDDEDDYVLVRDLLAETEGAAHVLDWVSSYDAGLEAIRRQGYDVCLLDYRLGRDTGLDLLREAVAAGCKAPLILLTGQGDRDVDLAAMRGGAADFLPKDRLTPDLLERSIRYAIERRRTEEALRQAQKMEAVGRLAGGIAHDFNNMMTVVCGFSETLLDQLPPDAPVRELVEEIRKAGERCAALTRQLLAFSRKQLFALRALDLNAVLAGMENMLRPLLGEDIDLVLALDPALGRVRGDPAQLEQVILNLCANARDAMPRGGRLALATANVELSEEDAQRPREVRPGPYILLEVVDTGCGMDAVNLTHVFEPFFTTKGVGEGTGLGLATVYGIVKQSGGSIRAQSEPGRGTTFRVYLPRYEEDVSAAAVPAAPPAVAPAPGGRETVLVVEDEEAVRGLVRHILQRAGYAVLEAQDGAEALGVCGQHGGPIDLLLTDLVMPRMGGAELVARLGPLRPEVRVLYLSAYTEEVLARWGIHEARAAFLQKPFTPDALTCKVREVLDQGVRGQGSGVREEGLRLIPDP
ncbi:MAG: response regulator [Planctomycetes bacterium]|nr:response regulator [Planctomycetota bacterium]